MVGRKGFEVFIAPLGGEGVNKRLDFFTTAMQHIAAELLEIHAESLS